MEKWQSLLYELEPGRFQPVARDHSYHHDRLAELWQASLRQRAVDARRREPGQAEPGAGK